MTDLIQTDPWAEARFAYQQGATAQAVCARFHIGRSAFFARAAREGWRRAAQALPAPEPDEPPGYARPSIDLAEEAMAQATRAIERGRLNDARGWTRLAGELRRMALQEMECSSWNEAQRQAMAADERRAAVLARKAREHADSLAGPDSSPAGVHRLTHATESGIPAEPDSVDCPREQRESTPPGPLPPAHQRLYDLMLRGPDGLSAAEMRDLETGLATLEAVEDP